ncbi:MAG: hypothetical protein KC586_27570, partial [Myxococcales bacterium]|nr:hypothetical protein [Myxococcales bacterium]
DRVLVDLVDEEREAAQALAGAQDPMELQRVFAIVSKLVDEVAKASSPRLMLEMGLVRAATRPALRDVGELLARLERLERGGSPPSSSGARSGGSRGGEPPRGREPSRSAEAESRPAERASSSSSSSSSEARPQAPRPQPPRGKTGEKPWEILAREAMARSGGREPESRSSAPAADDDESPPRVSSAPPPVMEEEAPPSPVEDDDAFETDVATGAKVLRPALQEWERLVASLRDAKPALAAVLEHGVPRVVSKERIVLAFQHGSFYGRQAEAPAAKEAIAGAAAKRLGGRPVIEIRFDAEVRGRTVAAIEATRREAERSAKKRRAMSHPAVLDAIEVFPEARGKIDVRIEDD